MINRFPPAMGVGSYKTYQARQPKTEKTRIGSCEAAGCASYEHGWRSVIDVTTELGQRQQHYIRHESGRRFTEYAEGNGIVVFTFWAGQQCFQTHHVPDRPQFFSVRDGDWRGNPTNRSRLHTRAADWVEDFAEHQAKLAEQIERG
jgi:hypothetical protein